MGYLVAFVAAIIVCYALMFVSYRLLWDEDRENSEGLQTWGGRLGVAALFLPRTLWAGIPFLFFILIAASIPIPYPFNLILAGPAVLFLLSLIMTFGMLSLFISIAGLYLFLVTTASLVSLAGNGAGWAPTFSAPYHGEVGWAEISLVAAVLWLLVGVPDQAFKIGLNKGEARQARRVIVKLITAASCVLTGVYLFMLHFSGGPLHKVHRGPLLTGIVFAVVLLAPAYQSVVTAFWRHGIIGIPEALIDYWGDTGAKVRAAFARPTSPGRWVLVDPEAMFWNESLTGEVKACFETMPSEPPPKAPAKPVKRLLNMAAEITMDKLFPGPNTQAHQKLYAVLDGQTAQYKQSVEANLQDILTADARRITANRLTQQSTETIRHVEAGEQSVNDAFRMAARALGTAIANGYAKKLALEAANDDSDFDIYMAKAKVAALIMVPGVVNEVENAADQIVKDWFSSLHAKIKSLNEDRRAAYDDVRQQAKDPQEIDVIVPVSRIEMTTKVRNGFKMPLPKRDRHVLSDKDGNYPVGKLGSWEIKVLDIELGRDNTVAWYRNPSAASKDAVQVPWREDEKKKWKPMQPNFIFFSTKADGAMTASIVDPHGHHLPDSLGKLRGLADFAEEYGNRFMRVESISMNEKGDLGSETKGTLRMLDLTDPETRQAVRESQSAADAYRTAGQEYQ